MRNRPILVGTIILINSCIWGFAMIMSARTLSGTGAYEQIQNIFNGCAAMYLIVVGGGLAGLVSSFKSENAKDGDK